MQPTIRSAIRDPSASPLQGTFTAPAVPASNPTTIEVDTCWSASGSAVFGLLLLVGPGVAFPLDTGTVNLPKPGVQQYVIGKFNGAGVFVGAQIRRTIQLPALSALQTVNWALYPAIIGGSVTVGMSSSATNVVVLPDNSKVYVCDPIAGLVTPVLAARSSENWIDVALPPINTATSAGNGPTDLAVAPDDKQPRLRREPQRSRVAGD